MRYLAVMMGLAVVGCAMNVDRDDGPELALPALSGVAEDVDVDVLEDEVARWNDDVGAMVFWEDARDTTDGVTVVVSIGEEPSVRLDEAAGIVMCEVVLSDVDELHDGLGACLGVGGEMTAEDVAGLLGRL